MTSSSPPLPPPQLPVSGSHRIPGRFPTPVRMSGQTASSLLRGFRRLMGSRPLLVTEHSRLVRLGVAFGQILGLPSPMLLELGWALLLHDVGKLAVPDAILEKPGQLTEFERAVVRKHPAVGEILLAGFPLPRSVMDVVRHHHERWDGTGYPDGLMGVQIPLLARIASVVDAYDAMTTPRPYRPVPLSPSQAVAELRRCAGTQFDPYLVCAFAAALRTHGLVP